MSKTVRVHVKGIRQACDACHYKKIRCLRSLEEGNGPCHKCNRDGLQCVFSPALKTGRPRKPAAARRPDPCPTSGQLPPPPAVGVPGFPPIHNVNEAPHIASNSENLSGVCCVNDNANENDFAAGDCPQLSREAILELGDADKSQQLVLGRLEQLSALQQQLVAKRRENAAVFSQHLEIDASHAIHELLQTTQKVTQFDTWFMTEGAKFAWRNPMLDSMSDETALMMVVSPATLVLEVFIDILELAFPSLKDASSESKVTISDNEKGLYALDPALLLRPTLIESQQISPTLIPDVKAISDLENPVCVCILLTTIQEQLDAMRAAADTTLAAFPRMNSATGARGLLPAIMDQYLGGIRSVQAYVSRAGGNNLLAGLN